jgi:hypothetical protein
LFLWPLDAAPAAGDTAPAAGAAGTSDTAGADPDPDENDDDDDDDPADARTTVATAAKPPPPAPMPPVPDPGGRVPFGLRKLAGRFQEHPQEAPVVRTILRAAAQGLTADLIEQALMAEHGPWVRGAWVPKEAPRHIRRILGKAAFYRQHLSGLA